jgi:hypothetical protein
VLNENSYVLAEYDENTGTFAWHRVVLTSQKLAIEQRVSEQFPMKHSKRVGKLSQT